MKRSAFTDCYLHLKRLRLDLHNCQNASTCVIWNGTRSNTCKKSKFHLKFNTAEFHNLVIQTKLGKTAPLSYESFTLHSAEFTTTCSNAVMNTEECVLPCPGGSCSPLYEINVRSAAAAFARVTCINNNGQQKPTTTATSSLSWEQICMRTSDLCPFSPNGFAPISESVFIKLLNDVLRWNFALSRDDGDDLVAIPHARHQHMTALVRYLVSCASLLSLTVLWRRVFDALTTRVKLSLMQAMSPLINDLSEIT